MSKEPPDKKPEAFQISRRLAVACYELTQDLPEDEKTNFSSYIRRAALEIHVNIASGFFAKPKKRKKMFSKVNMSLIIIHAATGILVEVGLASSEDTAVVNELCALLKERLHIDARSF